MGRGGPFKMDTIKLGVASIVTAFSRYGYNYQSTIGSKVTDPESFLGGLTTQIQRHDTTGDRVPGQHYIPLPSDFNSLVSAGVGMRSQDPADYVLRVHRGHVSAYLRRKHAADVCSVAVVVYTRDAYLSDPDVTNDRDECERISSDITHVIVAVLASSAGGPSPLSPFRLVHNLAGGNKEAEAWSADEIRGKADESMDYWQSWSQVAD
ncbi:MAG: hypothetical protein CMI58_06195 [Parcubacteria group bacterium]|nr:hypothetical protein [Parcubacteria group bacterium]